VADRCIPSFGRCAMTIALTKLSVLAPVPGSLSFRHTSLIRSNGTQRPTFWVHQQAAVRSSRHTRSTSIA
jgi:hypothetical protein